MNSGVFISGTDTGIGKSLVSATLLRALQGRGLRALGMKPVASGCTMTAQGLRNEDAELLRTHGSGAPDYALVNPYALAEPIAPHLAARHAGVPIELSPLREAYAALTAMAQCVVVEGVGGWAVPLSDPLMQADLVRALQLPVILVVGLRLGCINHALLSARAIERDGCALIGWIGNRVDPQMACVEENLDTLRAHLRPPCLGVLPHAPIPDPRELAPLLHGSVDILTSPAYPQAP